MLKKLTLVGLALLFCSCGKVKVPSDLDDKVSQMLMVDIGNWIAKNEMPDKIYKGIKEGRVGGIISYGCNATDGETKKVMPLSYFVDKIQANQKVPLIVSVDAEGGNIDRLIACSWVVTLSAKQLGEKKDTKSTYEQSVKIADYLKTLKVNTNLAPVVDLDIYDANPSIAKKERSFSKDPLKVYEHAKAFIKAQREKQIITTLKHFPGIGSASKDSHLDVVDVTYTWSEKELIPYQKLIADKMVDAIMVGHIFNRKLDPEYPATLSHKTIQGLLRYGMGYDGVVISDDLYMKGIRGHYPLEEIITLSIDAGVDILLFANTHFDPDIIKKAHKIIIKKVRNGEISIERINQSYDRIMKLKRKLIDGKVSEWSKERASKAC